MVSATLSPFAAELESALENPRTLPPRRSIADSKLKRVLVLVKEYMKTDDYKKILEKRIQKSLDFADGEEILIYINPSDAHLKDDLEAKTGSSLTVSREDFIGGTRAVMQKRRILIDYSFKSALSEEYDNFLFLGGDNYV